MKIEIDKLAQYPSLKTKCQERRPRDAGEADEIENCIADAVNGALAFEDGEEATAIIKHLALAFLYMRARKQKAERSKSSC